MNITALEVTVLLEIALYLWKYSYNFPDIVHSFGWSYADSQEPYISSLDDLEDVLQRNFNSFEITEIKRIH